MEKFNNIILNFILPIFDPGVGLLPESNKIVVELLTPLFDPPYVENFKAVLAVFLNILL
jgi:hypothetical protein